jgi:hypothetical protein
MLTGGGGSVASSGDGGGGGGVENERGAIGGGALDHVMDGITSGFTCAVAGAGGATFGFSGARERAADPPASVVAGGLGGTGLGGPGPPFSGMVLG